MMVSAWPWAFVQELFFWSQAAKNEKRAEMPPGVGLKLRDQGQSGNAAESRILGDGLSRMQKPCRITEGMFTC
jgi:hypothetical protein